MAERGWSLSDFLGFSPGSVLWCSFFLSRGCVRVCVLGDSRAVRDVARPKRRAHPRHGPPLPSCRRRRPQNLRLRHSGRLKRCLLKALLCSLLRLCLPNRRPTYQRAYGFILIHGIFSSSPLCIVLLLLVLSQPVTPPSLALMTGRPRYLQLDELLGRGWRLFSATASDQVKAPPQERGARQIWANSKYKLKKQAI